jgi:hypothetical protein
MPLHIPKAYLNAHAKPLAVAKSKIVARAAYNRVVAAQDGIADALRTNAIDTPVSRAVETFEAEKDMDRMHALDYPTWLQFAAPVYHISPRIEDYIIVNTMICPSDIPNRNGIAFPAKELAAFQPPPTNRQSFKAWTGCPVHLEHDNEDHTKAYGVILDSSMSRVTGYGNGKLWKVMGLLAIDKNKYPEMAGKVLRKEINTYSMGALVDSFRCGYCDAECTAKHVCGHITSPSNVNWKQYQDFDGSSHLAFLNAYGISPIECSIVEDPAWAPALSDEVSDPWGEQPKPEQGQT